MRKICTMLLKKIHLLKNRIDEYIVSKNSIDMYENIEKKIYLKIKNLEENLESLKEDNISKNTKIDELNKKIAFYEKEVLQQGKDLMTVSSILTELYSNVNSIVSFVESSIFESIDNFDDVDDVKKKKTYH